MTNIQQSQILMPEPSTSYGADSSFQKEAVSPVSSEIESLTNRESDLDFEISETRSRIGDDEDMMEEMQIIHEYNQARDAAEAVIGVVADLTKMPLREVYENLGFDYEEDDSDDK
ncbi:hypothetical protein C0J52_17601 [Blattella germanica]|nr:hypothetical protein C0J52_17601 [Blattella germanica]